jgi:hypothetical protein
MAESHQRREDQGGVSGDLVAELGRLGRLEASDATRLMGVVMALAGEVFVLRAQVERLTRALHAVDAVGAKDLAAAGASEDMQKWLAADEAAFARTLTEPFLQGDRTLDATRWMREP